MTNGEEVFIGLKWFNEEILPAVLKGNVYEAADAYGLMKALAYHELSHVRFTPRFNHEPTKTIRKVSAKPTTAVEANMFKAYNLLEDMRIERLFVGEFAPAKVLFTNLVMRYIVDEVSKKEDNLKGVYTMIAGRDYLSRSVRLEARKALVEFVNSFATGGSKVADKVDALVTEYCSMTFPRDNKRAVEIVREYSKLLVMLRDAGVEVSSSSSTESTLMREWEADHPYWTDKAHEAAGELDLDDLDDEDEESASTDDGGTGPSEKTSEEAEGSGNSGDSGKSEEAASPKEAADGCSSGEVNSDLEDLKRSIEEESKDASDKTLDIAKEDLKSINKKLTRSGEGNESVTDTHCSTPAVTAVMRSEAKKLKSYIRTVFSDIEPEYARGFSSGRLNVRDLMDARGTHTDIFDVWKEYGDGTDFEVVVAIDTSGSMSHYADGRERLDTIASKAMWVVHRAFSDLDIPVTVIEYNTDANVLITPNSKCNNSNYKLAPATGGTAPRTAFAIAKHVFARSNAEHKLLITMTDGEWFFHEEDWEPSHERELMNEFSTMGVHSVLVTFESRPEPVHVFTESGKHNGHDRIVRLSDGKHHLLGKEVGKTVVELANRRILAG